MKRGVAKIRTFALALMLAWGMAAGAQPGDATLPGAGAQPGDATLPGDGAQPGVGPGRLILTDGSYQEVTEWRKEGDRVKYLSEERGEWEELPVSLVDWKATDEWNASAAARHAEAKEELKQESGEQVADRKEEALNTPQVLAKLAPELRLPAAGGVFLLEEREGKPVLQQVQGSKVRENDHEGEGLLKKAIIPAPILGQSQTMELQGAAAKVRVKTAAPSIFVDVEYDQGVIAGSYFQIVRLERKRGLRVVATNKIGMGGGEHVKEAFLHSRAEKFSGDWWKVIPLENLTPGEYAIVISGLGEQESGVVWDFGVDR